MFLAAYMFDATFDPFILAIIFGITCGAVIAIVTGCAEIKRTVLSRIFGGIAVIATDFLLSISGIPHQIILYKYRNDAFVKETGRITVNETLVFGWSNMFFWYALTISFTVTAVCVFVYRVVKNRRIKNQADVTAID